MSKLGKRMIEGARQALAIARGEADPKDYRVHTFERICECDARANEWAYDILTKLKTVEGDGSDDGKIVLG